MDIQIPFRENVYAVFCHHRPSCRLSDAGAHGLSLPDRFCTCGAVEAEMSREVFETHNLVTTVGLTFYADRMQDNSGADAPLNTWADVILIESSLTPALGDTAGDITGTTHVQAFTSGYPQVSDPDGNNPGTTNALTTSYKAEYGTGAANGTINNVAISESGATLGSGTDPILMHAAFSSSFTKTSSDTLSVYINHTIANA